MKFSKKQYAFWALQFLLAIIAGFGLVRGGFWALNQYRSSQKEAYAAEIGRRSRDEINDFLEGEELKELLGEKAVMTVPLHYTYTQEQQLAPAQWTEVLKDPVNQSQGTVTASCTYELSEKGAAQYGFAPPFFVEITMNLKDNGTILETEITGRGKQQAGLNDAREPVAAEVSLSRQQLEAMINSYRAGWWKKNTEEVAGEGEKEYQVYLKEAPESGAKKTVAYELAVFRPNQSETWSQRFSIKADSAWENEELVWEEGDYNFDGYTDGRLGISHGPYRYFIWNFEKNKLEEDIAGLKNIQNALFLKEKQMVLGAEEKAQGLWNFTMYRYYGKGIGKVKGMELEENTAYPSKLLSQLQDFFENELSKSIREYLDREELRDVVGLDAKELGNFGYRKPDFGSPVYTAVFILSQKQREYLGLPVEEVTVEIPIKKDFSRIEKPDFYALSTDSQARRRYSKEDLLAAERRREEGLSPLGENEAELYVTLGEGLKELRIHFELLKTLKENLGTYLYEMKVYEAGSPDTVLQTMQFKSNMGPKDIYPAYEQYFNPVFEDFDGDGMMELRITRLISADEIYDYYKWNKRKGRFYLDHTETVSGEQAQKAEE